MNLEEFQFFKKLSNQEFADAIGISIPTLIRFKGKAITPRLIDALKIFIYSDHKVTFEEMFADKDINELKEWLTDFRKINYEDSVKIFLENLMESIYKDKKIGVEDVREIYKKLQEE